MRRLAIAALAIVCLLQCRIRAEEGVEIVRDRYGVPHIIGRTDEAALYGLGYCAAEDRLAQMEQARLRTLGWTAAVFGPSNGRVEKDLEARRRFGGETVAQQALQRLNPHTQAYLRAFVAGINHYIDQHQQDVLSRLKLKPAPFAAQHVVLFALARSSQPTAQYKFQRLAVLTKLKAKFGQAAEAMTEDLLWNSAADSVPTILRPEDIRRLTVPKELQSRVSFPQSDRFFRLMGDRCVPSNLMEMALCHHGQAQEEWDAGLGAGSTAVALSGKKTASGAPMLISYPALGRSLPGPLYESHLISPSWNIAGAHFPLLPIISIGASPTLAFGQTNGVADQTDIYVEELNPDNPREYRFRGDWKPMQVRMERIDVQGAQSIEREVLATVHGPVERLDLKRHVAYAVKDAVYGDEATVESGFASMSARTIMDLEKALQGYGRGQNILAIDQSGSIAYWHVGRQPLVPDGFDRRLPLPGTGAAEWQGFVPFEQRPRIVDPDWQFLQSSNNKPAFEWNHCGEQPSFFGPLHMRPWKVTQWLLGAKRMTLEQFEQINARDKYLNNLRIDPSGETEYSRYILQAIDGWSPPEVEQLISRLRILLASWDGSSIVFKDDNDLDSAQIPAAETILTRWRRELFDATFRDEFGDMANLTLGAAHFEPNASIDTLYLALAGRLSRNYFDDTRTEQIETSNDQIRAALLKVLKQMAAEHQKFPDDPAQWDRPAGVIDADGLLIPTIARGPDSYRFVAEILPGESRLSSAGWAGESERKDSAHYSDQLENYVTNRHKPLSLDEKLIREKGGSPLRLHYSP